MNSLYIRFFLSCTLLLFLAGASPAADFPYRKNYPDVPIIELKELRGGYEKGEVLLVDARTKMEFDTIHPRDALHIDFSTQQFQSRLLELGEQNPDKSIVIYDNGITCLKCYLAVQDALDEDMENVYAFDGGVQAWAEAYPQDTILMGELISDPVKQLIPYEKFQSVSLEFETFRKKAAESANAKIIDARDPKQRTKKLPGFENAMPIPLDKLIANIIEKGHMKNSQLFIFDQVGRQVRWLMYYLDRHGYKDYYFLDGGATAVLMDQEYR